MSQAITVKLPISTCYQDYVLSLDCSETTLSLPLVEGAQVVKTAASPVGKLNAGGLVHMSLSVWYEYCAANHTLTLCNPQMETPDTSTLSMQLDQHNTLYQFYACPTMQMKFDSSRFRLEGNGMDLLNHRMTRLLSKVTSRIREEALRCGLTVQVRTPMPELSEFEKNSLQVLFQGNTFAGFAEPGKSYGNGITVHPLSSTWGGTVTFAIGESFANVIGSTGDQQIGGLPWIRLWENQFGTATACTSFNFNGFICGTNLVGGHVIEGKVARTVAAGSNSVYIMPICIGHNNNNNVYMSALQYQDGVWLTNYHNP